MRGVGLVVVVACSLLFFQSGRSSLYICATVFKFSFHAQKVMTVTQIYRNLAKVTCFFIICCCPLCPIACTCTHMPSKSLRSEPQDAPGSHRSAPSSARNPQEAPRSPGNFQQTTGNPRAPPGSAKRRPRRLLERQSEYTHTYIQAYMHTHYHT